jgi:hypothetical protein
MVTLCTVLYSVSMSCPVQPLLLLPSAHQPPARATDGVLVGHDVRLCCAGRVLYCRSVHAVSELQQ